MKQNAVPNMKLRNANARTLSSKPARDMTVAEKLKAEIRIEITKRINTKEVIIID